MSILGIVALCAARGGCAFQRAEIAQDARAQMVGMTKEQVLACMGAPANKAAEGRGLAFCVRQRHDRRNRQLRSVRRDRGILQQILQHQHRVCRRSSFCSQLHGANRWASYGRQAMRLRYQCLRQAAIAKP